MRILFDAGLGRPGSLLLLQTAGCEIVRTAEILGERWQQAGWQKAPPSLQRQVHLIRWYERKGIFAYILLGLVLAVVTDPTARNRTGGRTLWGVSGGALALLSALVIKEMADKRLQRVGRSLMKLGRGQLPVSPSFPQVPPNPTEQSVMYQLDLGLGEARYVLEHYLEVAPDGNGVLLTRLACDCWPVLKDDEGAENVLLWMIRQGRPSYLR